MSNNKDTGPAVSFTSQGVTKTILLRSEIYLGERDLLSREALRAFGRQGLDWSVVQECVKRPTLHHHHHYDVVFTDESNVRQALLDPVMQELHDDCGPWLPPVLYPALVKEFGEPNEWLELCWNRGRLPKRPADGVFRSTFFEGPNHEGGSRHFRFRWRLPPDLVISAIVGDRKLA
jgi:hypothetical protein